MDGSSGGRPQRQIAATLGARYRHSATQLRRISPCYVVVRSSPRPGCWPSSATARPPRKIPGSASVWAAGALRSRPAAPAIAPSSPRAAGSVCHPGCRPKGARATAPAAVDADGGDDRRTAGVDATTKAGRAAPAGRARPVAPARIFPRGPRRRHTLTPTRIATLTATATASPARIFPSDRVVRVGGGGPAIGTAGRGAGSGRGAGLHQRTVLGLLARFGVAFAAVSSQEATSPTSTRGGAGGYPGALVAELEIAAVCQARRSTRPPASPSGNCPRRCPQGSLRSWQPTTPCSSAVPTLRRGAERSTAPSTGPGHPSSRRRTRGTRVWSVSPASILPGARSSLPIRQAARPMEAIRSKARMPRSGPKAQNPPLLSNPTSRRRVGRPQASSSAEVCQRPRRAQIPSPCCAPRQRSYNAPTTEAPSWAGPSRGRTRRVEPTPPRIGARWTGGRSAPALVRTRPGDGMA